MAIDLSSRHLLVIGGSGAIGGAVVDLALDSGARVAATSRSGRTDDRDGLGWHALDITEHGAVGALLDELGDVTDIVVAGAAKAFASLVDMDADDLVALVDTKLWGSFHVGRAAAEHLPDDGSLTFVSGLLASYPDAASPVAAISAAVDTLGRGLAVELAPIRVNVVSPDALGSTGRGAHRGAAADVALAIVSTITNPWMSGTVLEIHGAGKP